MFVIKIQSMVFMIFQDINQIRPFPDGPLIFKSFIYIFKCRSLDFSICIP